MKAILGFIAFVVVIIFVLVLFIRGGRDNPAPLVDDNRLITAAQSDADFKFKESGPIVAEENHYRIEISVSRSRRTIDVYRGYDNLKVASNSFGNTEASFEQFLSALDNAGYRNERRTSLDSEAGVCPKGRRYVMESNQFGEEYRRWTSSCPDSGNFGGLFSVVRELYQQQIPDYTTFIANTRKETGLKI